MAKVNCAIAPQHPSVTHIGCSLIMLIVLPALLGAPTTVRAHNSAIDFQPDWEDDWHFRERSGHCELHAHIPEAGEARFVASGRQRLAFEFQAQRDLFAVTPTAAVANAPTVEVVRVTPPWHPQQDPQQHDLGRALHVAGGGAIARGSVAQKMLWALRAGYYLELRSPAWFDAATAVGVLVPAQAILPALERFLTCARSAVSVAWNDISRSRVSYPVDRHELAPRYEARLQDVVHYALADPDVRTIYVDGHADASGEKRHNMVLSKQRAEGVAAFVREILSDANEDSATAERVQVVVRYHGANYPIVRNNSPRRKARNRRTTVRLERMGEVLAAN